MPRADNRVLRVLDVSPKEPGVVVEVLLDEQPLRAEMWAFGGRAVGVSLVISLITGGAALCQPAMAAGGADAAADRKA